jgi:hypothetical protein
MSTLNVGSMAARLGLDPSEFLDKMKGVEGFNSGLNQRMSAEMKRTNREGAESFRLIDEALGIHVSRPLTRLLTNEFPAFAKGLQSVLGIGAAGALATVGFEFAEHIAASIEKAKKAQQEYDDAIHHTEDVLAELGASHARTMEEIALRMAALQGKPGARLDEALFKIDSSALAEAKKGIDEITETMEKEAKAGAKVAGVFQQIKLAADFGWHNFWSDASAQADIVSENFQNFRHVLDLIMESHGGDPMQGMRESLRKLDDELSTTGAEIARKLAAIQTAAATTILVPGPHGSQHAMHPDSGINADVLAQQQQYFEMLSQQQKRLREVLQETSGHQGVALKENAIDQAKKDAEKAKRAIRELQEEMKGWNEENDRAFEAWIRLNAELDKSVEKLNSEAFKDFNKRQEGIRKQFAPYMTQQVAPPPGAPMLADQAELQKVTADQTESWRKAGEILAQIETPAQKYATGLATIKELQAQGRLTSQQMAQATQLLDQEMVKAADRVHKLQEEMMKLLERSDSAKDGLKAFWLELEINGAENGKFAFSFASTMFKDFEDGIAKTILATRNQHHELKMMWENYFKGLEEMALKFAISKSFASLANLGGTANAGGTGSSAAGGIAGLLAKLFSSFGMGGGGGSAATAAAGSGGGIFAGEFAGGGDVTPGSSFIAGEAGAERVDLSRGGAHITPLGGKASGGDIHQHYDLRGAVVTDDLLRKADAARMIHASGEQSVARAVSMQNEISKRSRPTR